jgi:hypothetical protein
VNARAATARVQSRPSAQVPHSRVSGAGVPGSAFSGCGSACGKPRTAPRGPVHRRPPVRPSSETSRGAERTLRLP